MKSNLWIISATSALFLFTGCTTEYGKQEILDYCKENYGLDHLSVSDDLQTVTGEDDMEDTLWTLTMKKEPKLTFHVKDDVYWGMEAPANRLVSDVEDVMLQYLMSCVDQPHHLSLVAEVRENMQEAHVEGHYRTLEELNILLDELTVLKQQFTELGYTLPDTLDYILILDNPVNDRFPDMEVNGSTFSDQIMDLDHEDRDRIIRKAVECWIGYGFSEALESVDPQLIQQVIHESDHRLSLVKEEETVPVDDLLAATVSRIHFSTLYHLLVKEGFEVSGDPSHFTFTSVSGSTIEISDDFTDGISQGHPVCFHLEDGERVEHEFNGELYFMPQEVQRLSGLAIDIGK